MHGGLRWWVRGVAYVVFALSCAAVAVYAFKFLYGPVQPGNPLQVKFALSGWNVPAHFFFGGAALLLAPLQVYAWLRGRWPRDCRRYRAPPALDVAQRHGRRGQRDAAADSRARTRRAARAVHVGVHRGRLGLLDDQSGAVRAVATAA